MRLASRSAIGLALKVLFQYTRVSREASPGASPPLIAISGKSARHERLPHISCRAAMMMLRDYTPLI